MSVIGIWTIIFGGICLTSFFIEKIGRKWDFKTEDLLYGIGLVLIGIFVILKLYLICLIILLIVSCIHFILFLKGRILSVDCCAILVLIITSALFIYLYIKGYDEQNLVNFFANHRKLSCLICICLLHPFFNNGFFDTRIGVLVNLINVRLTVSYLLKIHSNDATEFAANISLALFFVLVFSLLVERNVDDKRVIVDLGEFAGGSLFLVLVGIGHFYLMSHIMHKNVRLGCILLIAGVVINIVFMIKNFIEGITDERYAELDRIYRSCFQ